MPVTRLRETGRVPDPEFPTAKDLVEEEARAIVIAILGILASGFLVYAVSFLAKAVSAP
jgi:hypothetical protein